MKNYLYDYNRTSFLTKRKPNNELEYYLKVNRDYIKVSEEVFNVCKSSYNKIRNAEKNKVARSISNFEDIDQATFFVVNTKQEDVIHTIYINDLAKLAKQEIYNLPDKYREIAICLFLKEMTIKQTSMYLKTANTTVYDRKVKIQKILQEKLKKAE